MSFKPTITLKLFLTLFLIPTQSFAALSLEQSITTAYENNEEIKAADYSLKASQSLQTKSAATGLLPQISLDIGKGDRKYRIGSESTVNGDVDTRNFNISQNLFNGGKNFFDYKRAKSIAKKEQFSLMAKKQEIALQVIKSYIDILKYRDLLNLEKDNVKSYQKTLQYTKKKLKARDAVRADLAKVKADYIAALNNQKNLVNNLNSAKSSFVKLTGFRNDEIVNLRKFSLDKINQRFANLKKVELADMALQNNPNLKVEQYGYDAAKYERSMAKSSLSPTATLNYQISEDKKSIFFNNRRQRDKSIFVNFHIPIFNSGANYADIDYAKHKEQQEKHDFIAMKKKIIETVDLYLNEVGSFYQSYQSSKELEKANQIYFNSTKREERLGTKSLIDLMLAKQELHNSKTSRINYYYDYIMAVFKLQFLVVK